MAVNTGRRRGKKRVILTLVFLTCLFLAVFSSRGLVLDWQEDVEARSEYTELRSLNATARPAPAPVPVETLDRGPEPETAEEPGVLIHPLVEINPDFVGWINIPGTDVDYPVVQGADNAFYLNTTFRGERNVAGAIFMDYRVAGDFTTPITLLYGHNMRDGSMFSSLLHFLDAGFLNEYREITIVTAGMEVLTYRVIGARRAEGHDAVYGLDFEDRDAAAAHFGEAGRFLVLSTCGSNRDTSARVLVYALLVE